MSIFSSESEEEFKKINKIDSGETFNTGWLNFISYARSHQIRLFVLLHPTQIEVKSGEYNANGLKIIKFLKDHHIDYQLELEHKTQLKFYRDMIHYNKNGQSFLYSEMLPVLRKTVCKDRQ